MNAIAKTESGDYIDPHGGLKDIESRCIACVGVAEERFEEDLLRILRAIRFSITKRMWIDTETSRAIRKFASRIGEVSVERTREELLKAFMFNTEGTLGLLHEYRMIPILFNSELGLRLKPTLEK
jgi:tRNA nucleotidyltransferase (CCA-adding enzyme)